MAQPSGSALRLQGFADAERAQSLFRELPTQGAAEGARLLSRAADPDGALLQLVRLREAAPAPVDALIAAGGARMRALTALLGASRALGDYLVGHPGDVAATWEDPPPAREDLLRSVGADPSVPLPVASTGSGVDDLRHAYRRQLVRVAAEDAASPDPVARFPRVGRVLADLADAALEAALALARRDVDPEGRVRLAVIAMGKTGARELNYVSDVDVLYVVASGRGRDESREAVEVGSRLASALAQACSGPGREPPLWTVDASLRPEGHDGALVRTLDSYVAYYRRWADSWEFQALLKARFAAGDRALGRAFDQAVAPFVWSAAGRGGFVEAARAMRQRVEDQIPRDRADREIKLGPGGLRDVEFSAQLLQLVHGRTDASLRVRDTVGALEALSAGGYVGRRDAAELRRCYCFLRTVEHRAQLLRMRRTHLVPTDAGDLRALARGVGLRSTEALLGALDRARHRVRALHEEVFYRPIVAASAHLAPDEATLEPTAAEDRLRAFGYVDPKGALRHIAALTAGTTRRAAIQRHLLPVFIGWLADGADPDLGLLSFRTVSDQIGDSHWYLALLRDSGLAAVRLCRILPNSRWAARALSARPESIAWLDDDADLAEAPRERLLAEAQALVGRHPDAATAAERVRAVRAREVTRAGLADMVEGIRPRRPAIAGAADVALEGALAIAQRERAQASGRREVDVTAIAMGRYGGEESSYASDADVILVHRPRPGVDPADAAEAATQIGHRLIALLASADQLSGIVVDYALRPEGKDGPISRTLESYRDYYARWASAWERQAMLRMRVAAGDPLLGEQFLSLVNPLRYGAPPSAGELRDIRLLKARMETERLPRGVEPSRHVKLGPGGLSDVEWVVQLMQLRHAAEDPGLRTPSTMRALKAGRAGGYLDADQAQRLLDAWSLASRIRAANVLATGRTSGARLDVLPRERRELRVLSRLLGYPPGHEGALEDDWLRSARRCRAVMDQTFWI